MCGTSLQCSRLSFWTSSSQSLPFSKGNWPLHNPRSCPSHILHSTIQPMSHRLRGPKAVVLKAPPPLDLLQVTPQTLHTHFLVETQKHSRNCEFVYVSWGNFGLLEPPSWIITGRHFYIQVVNRDTTKIHCPVPSGLWALVPPLLIYPHLTCGHLHLCTCSGLDTHTHRNTHKHRWHKHACTHIYARHRDTNANRGSRCLSSWGQLCPTV